MLSGVDGSNNFESQLTLACFTRQQSKKLQKYETSIFQVLLHVFSNELTSNFIINHDSYLSIFCFVFFFLKKMMQNKVGV